MLWRAVLCACTVFRVYEHGMVFCVVYSVHVYSVRVQCVQVHCVPVQCVHVHRVPVQCVHMRLSSAVLLRRHLCLHLHFRKLLGSGDLSRHMSTLKMYCHLDLHK
eukprot:Lankesteria_metandrocarpae@DN8030_c0_g1_i1.p1